MWGVKRVDSMCFIQRQVFAIHIQTQNIYKTCKCVVCDAENFFSVADTDVCVCVGGGGGGEWGLGVLSGGVGVVGTQTQPCDNVMSMAKPKISIKREAMRTSAPLVLQKQATNKNGWPRWPHRFYVS